MVATFMRIAILLICLDGIIAWIILGKREPAIKPFLAMPLSVLIHASVFTIMNILKGAEIVYLDPIFINNWSQIVRIHSLLILTTAAFVMLAVKKYGHWPK